MTALLGIYNYFLKLAPVLQPLVLLLMRVAVAAVFISSGLVKIEDFSNTVALFQDEYMVPVLPPLVAAVCATMFELACPVFLILGLATRAATVPLLAMTAVIQFTYDQNIQHAYWALMLLTLLAFGAGRLSLDARIYAKLNRRFS